MKKNLVITYEIEYDPTKETEEDIIRYCHEIADEAANFGDFTKAELDGEVILQNDDPIRPEDLWTEYGAFEETAVSEEDLNMDEDGNVVNLPHFEVQNDDQ